MYNPFGIPATPMQMIRQEMNRTVSQYDTYGHYDSFRETPYPGVELNSLDAQAHAEEVYDSYRFDCGKDLFAHHRIPETSAELQNLSLYADEMDMPYDGLFYDSDDPMNLF